MLSSSTSADSTLLSPSSSSSSSSTFLRNKKNTKIYKSMEEVWNDITVNSLPNTPISHIHTIHHPASTPHFSRGFIFQDFLSGGGATIRNTSIDSSSPTLPQLPPSQTRPSTEFQFLDNDELLNSDSHQFQQQGNSSVPPPSLAAGVADFDALASSSVFTSFGGGGVGVSHNNMRRCSELDEDSSVDRRHKRMIKNRESAARSRARKQAYITELEIEVNYLREENEALRKQQRLLIEAPPAQLPKKNGLRRTSTAPF